ncbi:hypothetical protein ANSO36C_14470 [Nostoc cf. commune SO-36]|uniref:Uncharacterized protein n=1 Tax=Nostoc cf. commune SO-36 TaxID=449208 RepID=A0ABN6PYF3_NOSCO|nr:hypothetical protein ANSO36C_14470 [Nostoc cf. commune SO-36]
MSSLWEQWQKDLAEIVETLADEVERFFLGMSEVVDTFFELNGRNHRASTQ